MNGRTNRAVADKAAVGAAGGGVPQKEVFSVIYKIIRKASEEGVTDGRGRVLWIDFAPHVAVLRNDDGYVVWLWHDRVVVKIHLDHEFNVVGFDVEL
jgi:hypothetical protein